MAGIYDTSASWHLLPSILSQTSLSASFYRDSSYASDEVSDASVVTTITAATNTSFQAPEIGKLISPVPKSILKRSCGDLDPTDVEDSESGYESDYSVSEYAEHVEYNATAKQGSYVDVRVDNIFNCELTESPFDPDDSTLLDDFCSENEDEDYDGDSEIEFDGPVEVDASYITFENTVHFDAHIAIIGTSEPANDCSDKPEMTVHEMLEKSRSSDGLQVADEGSRNILDGFMENQSPEIPNVSEEHSRDMLETDKQLFVAYMNGIHGLSSQKYQILLHDRAQEIREGRVHSPFFKSDTFHRGYLNEVLNHVIGIFRNVVFCDEFDELARFCKNKGLQNDLQESLETQTASFLSKIERLLIQRLAEETVPVGKDELSFFAGGVAYALQNWSVYTSDEVVPPELDKPVLSNEINA